jgi:HK97 family phage major capsid protein
MPALMETLRSQFTDTHDAIRSLQAEIADQPDALPSDEQAANLDTLNTTLETLGPRIEQARAMEDRMHAGAEHLAGVQSAGPVLDRLRSVSHELHEFPTWGDYSRALAGGDVAVSTIDALDRMTRDLEHAARSRIVEGQRALVDQTTANLTGILPPNWLTDIVDFIGIMRPLVSAFSTRPLPPSGMTVNFPQVTVRPQVAKQATQKGAIASRATVIVPGSANVSTYGGGEDVSVQAIQRTDPAYLAIVNELYAEEMATSMDVDACALAISAATGPPGALSGALKGADIAGVLAAAGKAAMSAHANLDTWVMGLDVWAYVVGAVDTAGRPLFPNVGPSNPVGSSTVDSATGNARGLTFVADPNMAPTKSVAGDSRALTSMLGGVQTLRADNPGQLGVDFAVFEFAAFAVRRPQALVVITLGA